MTVLYHAPVLASESVSMLVTDVSGWYVDGTLGGAGHTAAILSVLDADGRVSGIDQDEEALAEAQVRVGNDPRFSPVAGNFGYMDVLLGPEADGNISGILLDLGVSSHQIDEAERGFSYKNDGPLDMRMSAVTKMSAEDVVNGYEEFELARIFFEYGEERNSRRIARAVIEARPLVSTAQLAAAIRSVVPPLHANKTLARIFQAVRIEVNRELEMLDRALKMSLRLLKPGGRLAVISYHSLEDRLVKHYMKAGNADGVLERDFYGHTFSPFKLVNKDVITAGDAEMAENTRARSAKLRVAEKV
jgi:16S rRNA (cytosine1402-N4)-methyltransferase